MDKFLNSSVEIVAQEFELFYIRDYGVKSELYEEMTKSEQRKFLSQHKRVMISQPKKDGPINVYIGAENDLFGKLGYPLDKATFSDYILKALSKAR